jgi:hypothetical protein
MRRVLSAAIAASAIVAALAAPVAAAPGENAVCIADFVNQFEGREHGLDASTGAHELGGIGHGIGDQGAGLAPTDCGAK